MIPAGICLLLISITAAADQSAPAALAPAVDDWPAILEIIDDQVARGDTHEAKTHLQTLVHEAEPELASQAADRLLEILWAEGDAQGAYEVAQVALERDPDSVYAFRFAQIPPASQQTGSVYDWGLGYRLEFDDNVAFPDAILASSEEDFRHVFLADLLYERPLGTSLRFFAQGHFYQSLHHDLDEFNQTRAVGAVSIGQNAERFGWRLPLELAHDRLDGDSFRTTISSRPGVFAQWSEKVSTHLYARLESNEYDFVPKPEEDRGGSSTGAGLLVSADFSERFHLHGYLEFNRVDADGLYWERDESIAYVYGEFTFSNDWVAGLALRYQDDTYDNPRPIFVIQQQDESKEVYLNLTHTFNDRWWARAQVSMVDHASNISVFDYDRNVYSISLARSF